MAVLVVSLVCALICGFITKAIFEGKGRGPGSGFALGFVLGVIGLIISLFFSDKSEHEDETASRALSFHRECLSCKELMRRDASVCPHCRSASSPWEWDGERWWYASEHGRYWLDESRSEWIMDEYIATIGDPDQPAPEAAEPSGALH